MNHFKNLKNGSVFIEVMFAIALLAIFGTSLFMTQAAIFSKVSQAHNNLKAHSFLQSSYKNFLLKLYEAEQKTDIDYESIKESETKLDSKATITIEKIPEKSLLYKTFEKNIHFVKKTITIDTKTKEIYNFLFTPEKTTTQKDKA